MVDDKLLRKLGCGARSQNTLQQDLQCTFGELASAIRRLSENGQIHMLPDGSWCHSEHMTTNPAPVVTPPISFGNASMPTLMALDIPNMDSTRPEAPSRQIRLIAMA